MELPSFIGQITTIKNEFSSILPKSTNVKTSQAKTDQVFLYSLLLNSSQSFKVFMNKRSLD